MAAMLEYNGLYMIFVMKLSLSIPSVEMILYLSICTGYNNGKRVSKKKWLV
jgi:hypothetical protein